MWEVFDIIRSNYKRDRTPVDARMVSLKQNCMEDFTTAPIESESELCLLVSMFLT